MLLNDNLITGSLELRNQLNQAMQWNQLKVFKTSNNKIRGQIPENIGKFFPNLEYLNASTNEIDGEIPVSFGNLSKLRMMDLSTIISQVKSLRWKIALHYLI